MDDTNYLLVLMADHLEKRLPVDFHQPFWEPVVREKTVWKIAVSADFVVPDNLQASLIEARIDWAIVPDRAFSDLGAVVSDMDSTLITIECIDEIAAQMGIKEQVSAITEQAMRGQLDFEQSLRRRVALLKGLPQEALQRVYDEALLLSPGAQQLVDACHRHQVKFILISGGFTFFTDRLQTRLNLDFTHANTLHIENGYLTGEVEGEIVDSAFKRNQLLHYRQQLGLRSDQILAVGDGANDIPMITEAGIGVAYHAKPKTIAASDCAIRFGGLDRIVQLFRDE